VSPSKQIKFQQCFGIYQCARLEVPLDWSNKSDPRTAAVAVIKRPAKVPVTDPRYGGPILINPGGPGGSGVSLALKQSEHLQNIVDSPHAPCSTASNNSDLYFDIIGFDPRGVNNTTPAFTCFPDDASQQNFVIAAQAAGIITDDAAFRTTYNRVMSVSGTCSKVMAERGRFMSTPFVVEDMMEITERLAEWRENKAKSLLKKANQRKSAGILHRTKWRKGEEPVQYIGFSYGTVLGSTLASMHPRRMKRVVIDGVVDVDDYYAGTWLSNLQDTDKIMTRFFELCHEAGPHKCAIYSATGPPGSRAILEQVLASLKWSPLAVMAHGGYAPDLITFSDLMDYIREAVYKPHDFFKPLAQAIFDVSVGNGSILAEHKQSGRKTFCPTSECRNDGPWSDACHTPGAGDFKGEVSAAIHCTDAPDFTGKGEEFHKEKWETLRRQSSALGNWWAEITMYCSNWWIRSTWRFEGEDKQKVGGNTSHPILLVSNTYDPVTPLRNAHKISGRFNGSTVLEQHTDGHCAIPDASLCIAKHVREYFQTGKLPEPGTVCKHDFGHFDDREEPNTMALNAEDAALLWTTYRLRSVPRERAYTLGI
ncbi:hypothetical protein NA57DRAFT_30177, partial [Rhizodiscina lignyota]